jgi:hypothetical protein
VDNPYLAPQYIQSPGEKVTALIDFQELVAKVVALALVPALATLEPAVDRTGADRAELMRDIRREGETLGGPGQP